MHSSMSVKLAWIVVALGLIAALLVAVTQPVDMASREGAISAARVEGRVAVPPPVGSPEYPTSLPQPYYTPEPNPTVRKPTST